MTSLYIHIPFCNRRCGYCDFNTFAGMKSYLPQYVFALCQEIKSVSLASDERLKIGTIFFGGGTPSLLSAKQLREILLNCREYFNLCPTTEITIEANPGTVDLEYLQDIRETGINRISFGMQSAHPDDLYMLDRQHQHTDVINAVAWSKQADFDHINLDLIFGIPGQNLKRWNDTLDLALSEQVDHFSLYSLIVEKGTPMQHWVDRGLVQTPDDDLAADMYETALDRLEQSGYLQYEISNWARLGNIDNRCLHNLQYWRFLPYLGLGAGAHGFIADERTENCGGIFDYIERIKLGVPSVFPASPACEGAIKLSKWDLMQEFMMVGFRLTDEGVSNSVFQNRFGFKVTDVFRKQIDLLIKQGLIETHPQDQERLRLTRRGRLFGNRVFGQFVGNPPPMDLQPVLDN